MKRVFTDENFKRSFLSNPRKAMGKFGLSKSAKGAILSIGVAAIAGVTDVAQILARIDPTQIW
jgi:hypothetical protein